MPCSTINSLADSSLNTLGRQVVKKQFPNRGIEPRPCRDWLSFDNWERQILATRPIRIWSEMITGPIQMSPNPRLTYISLKQKGIRRRQSAGNVLRCSVVSINHFRDCQADLIDQSRPYEQRSRSMRTRMWPATVTPVLHAAWLELPNRGSSFVSIIIHLLSRPN
jgi:hypothetical protein